MAPLAQPNALSRMTPGTQPGSCRLPAGPGRMSRIPVPGAAVPAAVRAAADGVAPVPSGPAGTASPASPAGIPGRSSEAAARQAWPRLAEARRAATAVAAAIAAIPAGQSAAIRYRRIPTSPSISGIGPPSLSQVLGLACRRHLLAALAARAAAPPPRRPCTEGSAIAEPAKQRPDLGLDLGDLVRLENTAPASDRGGPGLPERGPQHLPAPRDLPPAPHISLRVPAGEAESPARRGRLR